MQHGENLFLDNKAYNEFIQCHSYVDETYFYPPFIILEPTSTNLMKNQSQNIPYHDSPHFEILDNGGDEDAQEKCKKSDLLKVHMTKVEKTKGTKIVVCNYCSKEFKVVKIQRL